MSPPQVPGAYEEFARGADPEDPQGDTEGVLRTPPAPATESVGPALAGMVYQLERTANAMESLWRQARLEAITRTIFFRVQDDTDAETGDLALLLAEVPQGATGYLVHCAIEEAGVNPAAPDTSAGLWHAIYEGPQSATATQAQVVAMGNLLDCNPQSPTPPDAQIPFVYLYGSHDSSPTLIGPGAFWLVVDGATSGRQVTARGKVLIHQPEP